jgi:hypothetical protein
MYRAPPATTTTRTPWLLARPERAATLAFMLAALASASALGPAPLDAETLGMNAGSILGDGRYLSFVLVVVGVRVIGWGLIGRYALSLRGNGGVLVGIAAAAALFFSPFETMLTGGAHGQSQMLSSGLGLLVGIFLDPLRALSFASAARLTQRAAGGDPEVTAAQAAAAAFGWAAVWSLASTLVGVGVVFQLPAAVALLVSLAALVSVHRFTARPLGDEDPPAARARARKHLGEGLVDGAFAVSLAALLFVPIRLYEQLHTTRDEAFIAVLHDDPHRPGDVTREGREAGLRLFKADYGPQPTYLGWDEEKRVLLKGEALHARVPRTRPVPTALPR